MCVSDLDPATGALHGLTYPLAPDLDGIFSPLQALLYDNLARFGWPARIQWLRLLGADWLVRARRRSAASAARARGRGERTLRPRRALSHLPIRRRALSGRARCLAAASPIAGARHGDASRRIRWRPRWRAARSTHHPGGRVELLGAEDDRCASR